MISSIRNHKRLVAMLVVTLALVCIFVTITQTSEPADPKPSIPSTGTEYIPLEIRPCKQEDMLSMKPVKNPRIIFQIQKPLPEVKLSMLSSVSQSDSDESGYQFIIQMNIPQFRVLFAITDGKSFAPKDGISYTRITYTQVWGKNRSKGGTIISKLRYDGKKGTITAICA